MCVVFGRGTSNYPLILVLLKIFNCLFAPALGSDTIWRKCFKRVVQPPTRFDIGTRVLFSTYIYHKQQSSMWTNFFDFHSNHKSRVIYLGLPTMGSPYGKRDPYYSHTIPISLGILDWEWYGNSSIGKGSHCRGSLKIPLNKWLPAKSWSPGWFNQGGEPVTRWIYVPSSHDGFCMAKYLLAWFFEIMRVEFNYNKRIISFCILISSYNLISFHWLFEDYFIFNFICLNMFTFFLYCKTFLVLIFITIFALYLYQSL